MVFYISWVFQNAKQKHPNPPSQNQSGEHAARLIFQNTAIHGLLKEAMTQAIFG